MDFVDILSPSCALFLDFDGTLVDLAPQPGAVIVPSALVPTLQAVDRYLGGALALISGRPIEQIDAFLEPLRLTTDEFEAYFRKDVEDIGKLVKAAKIPTQERN